MHPLLRTTLQPLNLAATLTLLTVALSIRTEAGASMPLVWALLGAYQALFLLLDRLRPKQAFLRATLYALLILCALALVWLAPRTGTSPVLLVIVIAALAMDYPPRRVVPLTVLMNAGLYLALRESGHTNPGMAVVIYLGFQAFAALIAHYARSAERARDQLALVNADLLATRALFADSARDTERLRLARELHDVAGHKLTAMILNLRALAAEPALAGREKLLVAQHLSEELLGDIRDVVQTLRDARGLDLATALHALAAPLPRPRLELAFDSDLQITDPAIAETILRIVQEALTNTARHGEGNVVSVTLLRDSKQLRLTVEDDGRLRGPLREGNGLAGMRERVHGVGGILSLTTTAHGALRIAADLPLTSTAGYSA